MGLTQNLCLKAFEEEKMMMSPKSARRDTPELSKFMDLYRKRESGDRQR
jgi:hypothetical protein